MKKLLVLLFVFSLFSLTSYAQMQFGAKAGLNISNLSGSDVSNTDSKTGFAGGVFFMYQFSNMFAIQPEAYYTMKGAKNKGNLEGYDYTATLSYDYIEIPVLLKLLIPIEGSKINPAIFAGPSIGFNTTHKVKVEAAGYSAESDIENTKSTEFSLVFGGGLGFPIGKNELGVDIRYILGLSSLDDSSQNYDIKNGVLNINAYFGFSLN